MERFLAAIFLVLVGLGAVHLSFGYGLGDALEPGAGYFPLILGLLLAGLAAVIALREWRARGGELPPLGRWPVRQLATIIGGLVVFALLIGGARDVGFRGAGLVPAMFALVFISGLANRALTLRENLVLATGLTALSLFIFVGLFGMAIPLWPWGY